MLKNWQQQSSRAFVSCAEKGAARSVKFGVVFFSQKVNLLMTSSLPFQSPFFDLQYMFN